MFMNIQSIVISIEKQIREYLGDKKAVIGISGGIDSAVVMVLCVNAVGKENVIGIQMPYHLQSTEHGNLLIKKFGIYDCEYNIFPIVNAFPGTLAHCSKINNGNIRARVRMAILYAFAGKCNGIVVGTSNKTEIELGYFTKYGDGGCDIEPIGDLYKTEIFEMASFLKIPDVIISKKPSAELWDGQTDEDELGMTYIEMDEMLKEQYMPINLFLEKYGEKGKKLLELKSKTEHKRNMPPIFKVR